MSEVMPSSNQSWFQQQQQQQQPPPGPPPPYFFNPASSSTSTLSHDAIPVATTQEASTTTTTTTHKSTITPNSKGCLGKPIRRRSRASKKTPVTLLNAEVKDFRALVQRFTGCRTSEISFSTRKGPVNLNFATSQVRHHHFLPKDNSSAPSEIGFNNYQQHDLTAVAAAHAHAHAHGPNNNFNWRTEAEAEDEYKSRGILKRSGDQDQEHGDDMMFAMNNNYYMPRSATEFQSLDDIDDLKLDDIGTSLHELIGDIIA